MVSQFSSQEDSMDIGGQGDRRAEHLDWWEGYCVGNTNNIQSVPLQPYKHRQHGRLATLHWPDALDEQMEPQKKNGSFNNGSLFLEWMVWVNNQYT